MIAKGIFMAKKKDVRAIPAAPVQTAAPTVEKEVDPVSIVGGLQVPICAVCGQEIWPLESFETRPGDNARIHQPACKV